MRKLNKCTAKPGAISLNLEGRGLDSVAAGAFDGVIVSLIDLSNNALTDLPDGVFAKVQEVCTPMGCTISMYYTYGMYMGCTVCMYYTYGMHNVYLLHL